MQIPDTRAQPSHQLMRAAAENIGLGERVKDVRVVQAQGDMNYYHAILQPHWYGRYGSVTPLFY